MSLSNTLQENVGLGRGKLKMGSILFGKICLITVCHLNRETWKIIEQIGLETVNYYQFKLAIPLVSPHIAGIVRKKPVATAPQDSRSLIVNQNL